MKLYSIENQNIQWGITLKYNKEEFFHYHPKFLKELKKFIKTHKCPTLKDDLNLLEDMILDDLEEDYKLSSQYHRIVGLKPYVTQPAFVFKDFRCKGIKKGKKSGFRITFILFSEYVYFTEIYHKNQKEIEDKERINDLFK